MKRLSIVAGAVAMAMATTGDAAGLDGTDLTIDILAQITAMSTPIQAGFTTTAIVGPSVEFPSLAALSAEVPGFNVIDLAINAGNDFLEIDYDNTGTGYFSDAFFNGYRFTFDSATAATITGATVNESVTTNGLTNSRLSFSGNQLSVNVAGLLFAPDLFGRIDLQVEGGPGGGNGGNGGGTEVIPLPATLPFLLSSVALLAGFGFRRNA